MRLIPKNALRYAIRTILSLWFRVDVKGLAHYREARNNIIVANRTSNIDILLLCAFLPDELTIAIEPQLLKKWHVRLLSCLADVIAVDPSKARAARNLLCAVKQGKKCLIFPEGRLSSTAAGLKIYEGPSFVIDKSGADILPVRIQGAEKSIFSIRKSKNKLRLFPKISLNIQEQIQIPHSVSKCSHQKRTDLARRLFVLISEMNFNNSPCNVSLFEGLLNGRSMAKKLGKVIEDVQRNPLSYKQFVARCFILGKQIKKQTQTGEYVGVMMPTTVAGMVTFFACLAYRRIPAMLNFTMGVYNIHSACMTAKIKTIYTSRQFIKNAKIEDTVTALQEKGLTIVFLEDFKTKISLFEKLAGLIKGLMPALNYRMLGHKVVADDTGVVLFTSGSEGVPKGVALSHKNILSNVYQTLARVEITQDDVIFNALPIFHCFGLTAGSVLGLVTGSRIFLYPSPLHYKIIPGLVYDTNATFMFATDTFLTGYARCAKENDFNSIRYIFAGAEKVKPETIKHWAEKFGARILEGYGATEAAPVISTNAPMSNKLGTVGQLLPAIEYRIEPVDGISQGGRLWLKGPNVMQGYLRADNPGVIETLRDGWHDTGDIVTMDEQGFMSIVGRAKRFAKLGGEMVSLTAVESVASNIWPEQIHAAVVTRCDKKGEQIILLTEHSEAKKDEFVSFVRHVGKSELLVPKHIKTVGQIPVLASGKINYVEITHKIESYL
jgi:acyl-[acyl-carrier-protein]-phospholipid O-acyltransferase/long-chain-fatty-acid--[acyl-carrier-protein] ligase